ncbi:MAG: hypothetical protein D6719_01760 [Candidatus Dadabacteria bacterium]|nr:MAG: hypothetical protein D6719_01760 [Candidatus Dadabacteria bacterium]
MAKETSPEIELQKRFIRLKKQFNPHNRPPSGQFSLQGIVQPGDRTSYSINGHDFVVTSNTWIIGKLHIGAIAQVKGVVITGIGKCATKIIVR